MKFAATLVAIFVCSFAVAANVHADTSENAIDCVPSASDLKAIQKVQNDPSLSVSQELSQELSLRRQLLSQTITCATNDALSTQKTLNAVSPNNDGAAIQSQLSDKLTDAVNFYGIESTKLGNAGISGTQAIARELLAWRAANYIPLEGQISNFILWTANQNLFETAANRLTQTSRVVAFVESAAPDSELQVAFITARSAMEDAQHKNNDALGALAQFQPPDQSLGLIQQSLQSLALAYQKFSDLNSFLQKLLPTN